VLLILTAIEGVATSLLGLVYPCVIIQGGFEALVISLYSQIERESSSQRSTARIRR
jgi:hypothetical protein